MAESLLAKTDATFTCRKNSDSDSDVVIHRFVVQAAIVGVGTCVLMTRFLCTLSLIFCSNEQGMHVGFGGEVGHGLVTERRINSKGSAIRQRQEQETIHWYFRNVVGV